MFLYSFTYIFIYLCIHVYTYVYNFRCLLGLMWFQCFSGWAHRNIHVYVCVIGMYTSIYTNMILYCKYEYGYVYVTYTYPYSHSQYNIIFVYMQVCVHIKHTYACMFRCAPHWNIEIARFMIVVCACLCVFFWHLLFVKTYHVFANLLSRSLCEACFSFFLICSNPTNVHWHFSSKRCPIFSPWIQIWNHPVHVLRMSVPKQPGLKLKSAKPLLWSSGNNF